MTPTATRSDPAPPPAPPGAGYRLVRGIVRLLLRLFYRRIEVTGLARVPATGPLIVAANHHNAVVDAMVPVALLPRPVTVLANAPLFRNPLVGPFLRAMGAVPVNRRLEAGDDPHKNDALFAAATAVLRAGGAILIFPEGRTQPDPVLLPLRTGTARMLLAAERAGDAPCGVALLPVGLVTRDPGTFRAGVVEMHVGEPVPTADALAIAAAQPAEAARLLTARLSEALRARMVEAEDRYTLELLAVVEEAFAEETGTAAAPAGAEAALAWRQRVMRAARRVRAHAPHRMAEIRRRVEEYRARLEDAGVTGAQLGRPYTVGLVARYVADNAARLALGLPLALWGIACHAPAYWLTAGVVRVLGRTAEEEATDKIVAGVVLYPAVWALEAGALWWLAGGGAVLAWAVLLVPAGLLALAWRARLDRVGRQARALGRFLADRDLHRRLLAERRALVEELRRLETLAPEDAPADAR